jgi:hypothetical protein
MKERYSLWKDGHYIKVEHLTPEEVEQWKAEGYQVYRIYGKAGVYDE